LLVLLLTIAVLILLPSTGMAWVLADHPRLSMLVNQAQKVWPGVDMLHVVSFTVVGLLVRLVIPHARLSMIFLVGLTFSVVTELLQFYIPGRGSHASDVRDNMLGLVLGMLLGSILRWLWRRLTGRMG
jgi:VanZ family protein